MANMTFKANLLPDNTGTQKELGSSTARWNIYGDLNGNATTATTATKLGTANKGSGTKPIYLIAGVPTECSTYAGGTKVTLNNDDKGGSTASFYAPTTAGTANQILVSAGETSAPTWKATAKGAAYATTANGALTFGTLPISQGGTGKASWTADGLVYASATTTLDSKKPAWEAWGTGTTAGPTAKIQLGNKTYTSAAIPSASEDNSGIVTTGNQIFSGRKSVDLVNPNVYGSMGASRYKRIRFMQHSGAHTGTIGYDAGLTDDDTTNITNGQIYFIEYSPNTTPNTETTGKCERYNLPAVNVGRTSDGYYNILTTKEKVKLSQGGTGRNFTTSTYVNGIVTMPPTINDDNNLIATQTQSGALYATATNGTAQFGTLPVAQGGTGKTAQTAQRLCYIGTDGGITSGYHFATSTKVAIASTSEPTATFYVNGTAEIKTQLHIPSTAPDTAAPLVIGSKTGAHMELDKNKIVAKASETSAATLWFNDKTYVDSNGNIGVEKDQPSIVVHDSINHGIGASIIVGSGHQNHGLYSNGYAPSDTTFTSSNKWIIYRGSDGEAHSQLKIYGAVYNDYAEMRNIPEAQTENNPLKPGTCVREIGDGTMVATTERLQRGCKIISDTFGFNIGETEDCKTPIAVSGRALVYLDQDREIARDYIGWPVCSGPNGTVSIMTEEEEEKYPSRIIGTISEIPNYEKWGEDEVEVNGRIWIYVR